MAKKNQQQKPTFKSSKARKELAKKRAEEEAARALKRQKIKKFSIIGAIALSVFIVIFSTVSLVSCLVKTYEPISLSDMYTGSGVNKVVSDKLIALDGQNVSIKGYMCVDSSLANKIIYLAAKAGTSCPYCYDRSDSRYGEAMPIRYANSLRTIKFTSRRVLVKGRLEVKTAIEDDNMETPFRIYIDTIEEL